MRQTTGTRRRRNRGSLLAGPLVAAALLVGVALPTSASAACGTHTVLPSCFEGGDGNLVADGPGGLDWANADGVKVSPDPADGDTQFGGGNAGKEQDPDHWVLNAGSAQPKDDMLDALSRIQLINGELFLDAAFLRVGNSGDANLSFELNKQPGTFTNAVGQVVPRRSDGDTLITFDGGADPVIGICHWVGDERGESSDAASGWYNAQGQKISGNTDCGAINDPTIVVGGMNVGHPLKNLRDDGVTPLFPDFPQVDIQGSQFGEISVNLTKALVTLGEPNPCLDYGSFWIHSRSSTSAVSQMSDYVAPTPLVGAVTCGIAVDKTVAVNDGPFHQGRPEDPSWANNGDTLNYALAVSNTGVIPVTLSPIDDPGCGPVTIADGDKRDISGAVDPTPATFDGGDRWTFRCVHVLAPGDPEPYVNTVFVHGQVGLAANLRTFDVSDHADTGRRTGTLEVVKRLIPADDGGRFALQIDGAGRTAEPVGDGGSTGTTTVFAVNHTVGEAAAAGADLADYVSTTVCADGAATVAGGAGSGPLTVPVADGAHVVCTITNVRKATVVIEKRTDPAQPAPGQTAFAFASTLPGGDFSLVDGGTHAELVAPGTTTVTESDPHPAGYRLDGLVCAESKGINTTVDLAARRASIAADPGETVHCVFRNTRIDSQAAVVKTGPAFAYHGDKVTYEFDVTAVGNSALHDVHVSDDRCAAVSAAPVSRANDDGDGLLEPVGADGVRPEVWAYSCTMTIGAHKAGETNPVVNTATVSATDEAGRARTATAQHATTVLHQALALTKGPDGTSIFAGQTMTWQLQVSNVGDTSFPGAQLAVTDDLCTAAPRLASVNGDRSPQTLDPGERWTYTCPQQTSATFGGKVTNTGVVTGIDTNGRRAGAKDDALLSILLPVSVRGNVEAHCPAVVIQRGQAVRGPAKVQRLTVIGRNIRSVTFLLNGHVLRTVTRASRTLASGEKVWRTSFVARNPRGTYRIRARVRYVPGAAQASEVITPKNSPIRFSCLTVLG